MCMMAPCTPPNSSVPTENPPILALFLGIFNGPFFKSKNRHWSFESIQLSITSDPNTSKLSSNLLLLCSWRLTKTARCVMWCWWRNCIVDITRSNPNCGIPDGFFDHIGFWPSWSSREYGEEESVPYTKDQFMRGWPVALKQQSKVLSRNPSWFRKVSHEERFEIHLKHPQDVLRTRQWAIPFRLDVSLEGFKSASINAPKEWFSMEGTSLIFFFCRRFVSTYFVFLHQWWLVHDGEWFGKSILHGYIYLYYDTCLFIVCWNGSRKLQTSSVLFQSQMFPTLRFLNFIDRWDAWAHVFFFRLILGRTLALSLRPLTSVVSFLGHEGTTFSLTFICRFLRFSFTNVWILPCSHAWPSFLFSLSDGTITYGRCFVFGSIF